MPYSGWSEASNALPGGVPTQFGLVANIWGKRRLGKAQNRLEKYGLKSSYAGAQRARQGFEESSERQGQQLQQSLAARGLGTSSIEKENTQYFEAARARARANLSEREEMARQRLSIYRKQRTFQRRWGPVLFLDRLIGGIAGVVLGMNGGGGDNDRQPSDMYGGPEWSSQPE